MKKEAGAFDLAIIGGGPGGYVAAIRAAQLGMQVALIEKRTTLGGTCLNVGCIPSKALLQSTEMYHTLLHSGKKHGLQTDSLSVNWAQMLQRKETIVGSLTEGIAGLMKKNRIQCFTNEGKIQTPTTILVGEEEIHAKKIIIATGSEPIELPFLPFDETRILSSTGILSLQKIPKRLLIVGAGVIGLELGSVYHRLGAEVIFVEMMESICFGMDSSIIKAFYAILKKTGMEFLLNARVVKGEVRDQKNSLTIQQADQLQELHGDVVLVAIGRKAYTKGVGLENVGVQTDAKGMILVDPFFRTNIETIYAIGDVINGPMLAHKASEEGVAVVEHIAGLFPHLNYAAIPSVIYTHPEVASVGFTEEEARKANMDIMIGLYSFRANSRARCSGEEEGMVKIIGDKKSGRLLGLHIIGAHASEMIQEGVIALEKKATIEEIARASHAHPTLSEAIKEAALNALDRALHL